MKTVAENFRFGETFETLVANKGQAPGSDLIDTLPMVKWGRALCTVFKHFVHDFLALHYRADPGHREAEALDAIAVGDDLQLQKFWAAIPGTARGKDHPIAGLPPLSRAALEDYLVSALFYSTAVHELDGNILLDVTCPTTVSTRIEPAERFGAAAGGRPPQASIMEWFRIVGTCAVVTGLPRPKLVPEMKRQAEARRAAGRGSEAACYDAFIAELEKLSVTITRHNEQARLDKRTHDEFGIFNPKILETSVSL